MLVRGRASRLPGHIEVRCIRGGVATPPPRKAKATMNCRAPVVCLVTVSVSCLDTAAVPGGGTPPAPPPSNTGCLLNHSTYLVLGHSSRAGGGNPPGTPPRARSLVLGHIFCLVLEHSNRAGGEHPPRTPPSSTPPRAGTHMYLLIFNKVRCNCNGFVKGAGCSIQNTFIEGVNFSARAGGGRCCVLQFVIHPAPNGKCSLLVHGTWNKAFVSRHSIFENLS